MAGLNIPAIGIIGGSGFYNLPGLTDVRRVEIDTPFGRPSDAYREGRLSGRRVIFLARHGEHHTLLPGEINARANGVYLGIEGPQFSTRAESLLWRSWGADVIGMTNFPEVRLAREAEMCYGSLALSTDYDCWRAAGEAVVVTDVLTVLRENAERARRTVEIALSVLDPAAPCACHRVLDTAILTPLEHIQESTRQRLHALLERRLRQEPVLIEEPVRIEEIVPSGEPA